MTAPPVYVVNPNSTESVTETIRWSLADLPAGAVPIECVTLADGPPGIVSDADFDAAGPLVEAFAAERSAEASGFVVACFSDPGVERARGVTSLPVVGIQESSISSARELGERFGIVALAEASVERQRRSIEAAGQAREWAGSRALGVGIADLADRARVWPRLREVAQRLVHQDEADVVILGCAGMGLYREELERDLRIAVVDPCRSGVLDALGRLAEQASANS